MKNTEWTQTDHVLNKYLNELKTRTPNKPIAELIKDNVRNNQLKFTIKATQTANKTNQGNNSNLLNADLSNHLVDTSTWHDLLALAEARQLKTKIAQLHEGSELNFTEQRAVTHTKVRQALINPGKADEEHKPCIEQMQKLSEQLKETGITDIIHIGIGGSDLGPRLALSALDATLPCQFNCHFVANIDPFELCSTLAKCHPATTAIVICSKSFRTHETLFNAKIAIDWLENPQRVRNQVIAVTNNTSSAASLGIEPDNILSMQEGVGGRFSLWSNIGFTIFATLGDKTFQSLHEGAYAVDQHFFSESLEHNLPVAMGLMGFWYTTIRSVQNHCVLPYDHRIRELPSYLQQLEMESNGKSTNQANKKIDYATAPALWGNVGTNSQHSFHQLLHQGQHLIPADILLPLHTNIKSGTNDSANTSHDWLVANALAQSESFIHGRSLTQAEEELKARGLSAEAISQLAPHLVIPGNRPHSIITYQETNARTLGAMIALYEHKVFCQGILWNINSFDQWGVELGKQLAPPIFEALTGCAQSESAAEPTHFSPSTQNIISQRKG